MNSPANLIMSEKPSNWNDEYKTSYTNAGWKYSNDLSKNVVKDLIKVEENLVLNLREFL